MPIPPALGWYSIPGTTIDTVALYGPGSTAKITAAWCGGCMDTLRNRMIIWGGGHDDYSGNEVYVVNLSGTPSVARITPDGSRSSAKAYGELGVYDPTTPTSRHTYGFIDYISSTDRMFSGTYAQSNVDGFRSSWTLDLAASPPTWHLSFPGGVGYTLPNAPGSGTNAACAYDPTTDCVYMTDFGTSLAPANALHCYHVATNSWTAYAPYSSYGNDDVGYFVMAIDVTRRKIWMFGDTTQGYYDISAAPGTVTWNPVTTTGPQNIVNVGNPGLAVDPVTGHVFGIDSQNIGGAANLVYELNPTTLVWTSLSYPGGPPADGGYVIAGVRNGVYGRWRYYAPEKVFILCLSTQSNAYSFRATSSVPDTNPPTDPSGLTATAASQSSINLGWSGSTDPEGSQVTYLIERCTGAGCATFTQVGSVNHPTLTFSDTGLTPNTLYRYRVRATDSAGNNSGYTSIAQATTLAADTTPPTDPTGLTATAASYSAANLSWTGSTDAGSGVRGYYVERCAGSGCTTFAQVGGIINATSYIDSALAASTFYRYRVRAQDNAGNFSNYSNIASVTTLASGILQVGSTKPYTTLAAAIAVAQNGDTIECDPETYQNDTCTINQQNITIRGVGGGRAFFKWDTGNMDTNVTLLPNDQGIIRFFGSGLLQNLEFAGAAGVSQNCAGIRYGATGDTTIDNCFFHHNQNGILGNNSGVSGVCTIQNSEFAFNGWFDGSAYGHNIYMGHSRMLVFQYNYTHDSQHGGHTLKTRCDYSYITYSHISTKNSDGSLEIDFSNGGICVALGNIIEQGASSSNSTIVSYGGEGITNTAPAQQFYCVNNTFYSWRSPGGTFIQIVNSPALAQLQNNAYSSATGGTFLVGTATSLTNNHNYPLPDTDWVDVANANFKLNNASSPAVNGGIAAGNVQDVTYPLSLTPQFEYKLEMQKTMRATSGTAIDAGAYEYPLSGPTIKLVMVRKF